MADLRPFPDDPLSDPSLVRIEDLLSGGDTPEPANARDGLPRTFRMRADKHYVEMLDVPARRPGMEVLAVEAIELRDREAAPPLPELVESITRHGMLQPLLVQGRNGRYRLLAGKKRLAAAVAAGLREVPCIVRHADDEGAEAISAASNLFVDKQKTAVRDANANVSVRANDELARSLSALRTCANLLADPTPAFTQTTATSLVRAEVWRAECLLQLSRVLRGEISPKRKPVYAQTVVDRVLQAMEPETRLRGMTIEQGVHLAGGRIAVDEDLLVCAVSALLMATFTVADRCPNARVGLTAASEPGGEVVLAVTQEVASAPCEWVVHAGDSELEAWQGGGLATVAIVATRRIVADCDGRMTITAAAGGTGIHLAVPGLP